LRLVSVCRLTRVAARKNIDGVLRAIAGLPADVHVDYTVVGEGDDRPRLEALARENRCASCAIGFAGRLSRAELLEKYKSADLFVLPVQATATDVEGFGIVYVEAAASGVPVLASRAGLATDAIVDGASGILLDASTPDAIREGILRFSRERDRFPATQVQAIAEEFRWSRIVPRVRTVLARVASADPRVHAGNGSLRRRPAMIVPSSPPSAS
jgi:phosphatidylinositol alpha-1,6-mannosyltransferase